MYRATLSSDPATITSAGSMPSGVPDDVGGVVKPSEGDTEDVVVEREVREVVDAELDIVAGRVLDSVVVFISASEGGRAG